MALNALKEQQSKTAATAQTQGRSEEEVERMVAAGSQSSIRPFLSSIRLLLVFALKMIMKQSILQN